MPDSFLGNIGEDLDYREGVYMEDAVTEMSSTLGSADQDTSAINLCQLLPPEVPGKALLLGCGDPRNVLYTLFSSGAPASSKHFSPFSVSIP